MIELEDIDREELLKGWEFEGERQTFEFKEKGDMKWLGELKGQATQSFRRPSPHNNIHKDDFISLDIIVFFSGFEKKKKKKKKHESG